MSSSCNAKGKHGLAGQKNTCTDRPLLDMTGQAISAHARDLASHLWTWAWRGVSIVYIAWCRVSAVVFPFKPRHAIEAKLSKPFRRRHAIQIKARHQGHAIETMPSRPCHRGMPLRHAIEAMRSCHQGHAMEAMPSRPYHQGHAIKAMPSRPYDQGHAIEAMRSRPCH